MNKYLARTLLLLLLLSTGYGQTVISQYAIGKVYLSNGFILEGKNVRISTESVTINVVDLDQTLPLEDVIQVMVLKGKAKRFGKNCGLISLTFSGLGFLLGDGTYKDEDGVVRESKPKDVLLGALVFGGLSYGVGYGTGLATDNWEVVYLKRQ